MAMQDGSYTVPSLLPKVYLYSKLSSYLIFDSDSKLSS